MNFNNLKCQFGTSKKCSFSRGRIYPAPTKTKILKQAVKRHIDRFPDDFMFELTKCEMENWRSQYATSNKYIKMGLRRLPYVFTEQGVAMLSSVLTSERAILVNIQIMRAFTKIKELILNNKELRILFSKLEKKVNKNRNNIQILANLIQQLLQPAPSKPKKKIGFITDD